MPRVIRLNALKEKTIIHTPCGAEVGYFENEVETKWSHDALGGPADSVSYRVIPCPICKYDIHVGNGKKKD